MPKNNNRIHRKRVYEKCNFSCVYCGEKFEIPEGWNGLDVIRKAPKVVLEIDHIKPISKGGSDKIENKQALCWSCNSKKSDKYE